jgi:uncharacterized membrane protein
MRLLNLGLAIFLGIHLVPAIPAWRRMLVQRMGEARYKQYFSLASGAGLLLIVVGYALAERGPQLFAPVAGAYMLAPIVVPIAFILLAAANMPTHMRAVLRHPMLLGVLLWSGVHFLASGSLRASVLFGAFLVWALLDLVSAFARGSPRPIVPQSKFDLMSVGGGLLVALVFMALHRVLFGVPVLPFSF